MITRVVPVVALSLVLMGPALAGGPTSKESAATKIPGTSWRRGSSPQLDDKLDELRKLRRERRKKGAKVEELDKSIQRLVAEIVPELLRDLKSGAQDVRDRAAAQLAEVGAAAVPELEKLAASDDAEAKARAQSVLKLIREVEADDQGLWKQWAHSAKASSEFDGQGEQDEEDWNAIQACGKPDTEEDGDQ
ncbi:MAG: hypothetical protein HY716_10855, partial [Planctomycetes bacterium]|nr:hypothetical protein [Planctomycetota bacterium]